MNEQERGNLTKYKKRVILKKLFLKLHLEGLHEKFGSGQKSPGSSRHGNQKEYQSSFERWIMSQAAFDNHLEQTRHQSKVFQKNAH